MTTKRFVAERMTTMSPYSVKSCQVERIAHTNVYAAVIYNDEGGYDEKDFVTIVLARISKEGKLRRAEVQTASSKIQWTKDEFGYVRYTHSKNVTRCHLGSLNDEFSLETIEVYW